MKLIRLHVTAEGPTEGSFVKSILAAHLAPSNVYADARSVLTSKDKKAAKEYRGGLISYQKAKADIQTWMKEDNHPECRFTTMFDLYALPDDFPEYAEAIRKTDPYESRETESGTDRRSSGICAIKAHPERNTRIRQGYGWCVRGR